MKETNIEELEEVSQYFKAFAHPVRLMILELLSKQKTCVNIAIVRELPVGRTTAFQHLKLLEKIGLITSSTSGPNTVYCINAAKYAAIAAAIKETVSLDTPNISCGQSSENTC